MIKIFEKIRNKIIINKFTLSKQLIIGQNITIKGLPIIDIRDGAKIEIGDDVTLNSENYGYHINMHSPVKLFANIKKGAYLKIGNKTRIHGSCIHARYKIEIGDNCLIAANCQIFDCNAHHLSFDDPENRINTIGEAEPIIIEDNVWIGANSIILPGVTIGQGSIVAAGSVVTKNIPAMVIVAGNPAQIVKEAEYKIWSEDTEKENIIIEKNNNKEDY